MKLQKKETNHPQKKERVPVANSYNKAAFKPAWNNQLPVGKFKGRTLKYIHDNENWYYRWMEQEGVMYSWNLLQLIDTPVKTNKPKWDQMYSETYNRVLVGIRVTSIGTIDNTINASNLPY